MSHPAGALIGAPRAPLSAIIFDLDGTLVDSAPSIGVILNNLRMERGLSPLPTSCYRAWVSLGAATLVARSLDIEVNQVAPWVEAFRVLYRAQRTPLDALYPDVRETLADLSAAGIHLAVCSNKPEALCHKVLVETALDHYFSAVVGGDSAEKPKPDRAPFALALALLGLDQQAILYIGDSTVDQKLCAAVGAPFGFFTGGYDDGVDADRAAFCFDRFEQLRGLRQYLPVPAQRQGAPVDRQMENITLRTEDLP